MHHVSLILDTYLILGASGGIEYQGNDFFVWFDGPLSERDVAIHGDFPWHIVGLSEGS